MSEDISGAPPVGDTSAAVPPSPATDASDSSELQRLRTKLELVTQDKLRAGETNAKLNAKVQELEESLKSLTTKVRTGEQKQLEDAGQYRELWEALKETNKGLIEENESLKRELDAERHARKTETLRTKALQEISEAKALRPDQLLALLNSNLREVDGKPVVLDGGMEIPLRDHLARLKTPESGWDHHFAPNGTKGMGTPATAQPFTSSYGGANPFRPETRNLTEQARLFNEDPALYERLKAEAARG